MTTNPEIRRADLARVFEIAVPARNTTEPSHSAGKLSVHAVDTSIPLAELTRLNGAASEWRRNLYPNRHRFAELIGTF